MIISEKKSNSFQVHAEQFARYSAVALTFVIPISTAATNIMLAVGLSFWLFSGHLTEKLGRSFRQPVAKAAVLLFGVFLLGTLYSEAPVGDILFTLKKMAKLLFFLLLLPLMTETKWRYRLIAAFMIAMVLTLVLSILKVYGGLPISTRHTVACVFKDHIYTNLMMAVASFVLGHYILEFPKSVRRYGLMLLLACFIFYIFFMSEGRSGYIIFTCLGLLFGLQRFQFKGIILSTIGLFLLLGSAYSYSERFQHRLQDAIKNVEQYFSGENDTSLGARLEYTTQTWELSKQRLWLGWGTGSFKQTYQDYVDAKAAQTSQAALLTDNPHNEYLNILFQLGIVGLLAFFALIVTILKESFALPKPEQWWVQGLLLAFVVGCFANSWAMDSTAGYFFMVLLAASLGASYKLQTASCKIQEIRNDGENTENNTKDKKQEDGDKIQETQNSKITGGTPLISVIITTYNWPFALRAVLTAVITQKTLIPFEIIVADDGSTEETAQLVQRLASRTTIPIKHVWQSNEGFRAAMIRNKAILCASGEYLIFLDGDCIPRENFIERYAALKEPNTFVVGNRLLLNRTFTIRALAEDLPLYQWTNMQWLRAWVVGACNRFLPLLSIPLGPLRFLNACRWQGAKGCNLGIWKSDLLKINGWEEKFIGWGYEDSDLVIRLIHAGVKRKEGRYSIPVIHLWHPENDRSRERDNWSLLKTRQKMSFFLAEMGLNQHLHSPPM